ncbi:hypothetical protein [Methylophilus luteus]|uniref:Uncharacterized protein n=1 Tax=Methylophilus luteus TaxID=640108 RepID=A0ABW3F925_9PROT
MTRHNKILFYNFVILVFAIGCSVLAGWIFNIKGLVKISAEYPAMTLGTAICFVLSAFCLTSLKKFNQVEYKNINLIIPSLIAFISSLYLLEYLLKLDLGIDLSRFHEKMGSTGRPAINTVTGFLLFSVTALSIAIHPTSKKTQLKLLLSTLLTLIGVLGLLGYFLNLREMYNWGGFQSMALNTAVGMVALGVSLIILLRSKTTATEETDFENKIINITLALMLSVGFGISSLSFYLMQKRVESALQTDLSTRAQDQSELIYQIISHRSERAKVLSKSAEIIDAAKHISRHPHNQNTLKQLLTLSQNYIIHGFDEIDIQSPSSNVNSKIVSKSFFVEIDGRGDDKLVWENGYFLISKNPIIFDGVYLADLVTRQSLPPLNLLVPKVIKTGETNDLVICADAGTRIKCFPNRTNPNPFFVPRNISGQTLPMAYAVDQRQSGVLKATDYRNVQVLAAYTPIGDTGLGLVQKIDQSEIYNPVKLLMIKILIITIIILAFGYFFIRNQLKPLVNLIVFERDKSETEKARFIAATEGGIDNFYIFEAVRDHQNKIIDFRCLYLNRAGSELIKKHLVKWWVSCFYKKYLSIKKKGCSIDTSMSSKLDKQ